MNEFVSVPQIALELGAVDNTIRRYITRFSEFFVSQVIDGVKKYPSSAVEIINRISMLYQDGKKKEEIREILKAEFPPAKYIQKTESSKTVLSDVRIIELGPNTSDILKRIETELRELKEEIRKLNSMKE